MADGLNIDRKYGERLYAFIPNENEEMCVYSIQNIINGKCYIGITSYKLRERINDHFKSLRRNKHTNRYLQFAFNKYGEKSFEVQCLYNKCKSIEELSILEAIYCEIYQSRHNQMGYNLDIPGKIKKHSEETKQKIGRAHKGKVASPETLIKMRISQTGLKHPTRKKSIKQKVGVPHTEDTKKQISSLAKERWKNNPDFSKLGKLFAGAEKHRDRIGLHIKDLWSRRPNPASRALLVYNKHTYQQYFFWCVKSASEYLSISCSSIQRGIRRANYKNAMHPFIFSYLN